MKHTRTISPWRVIIPKDFQHWFRTDIRDFFIGRGSSLLTQISESKFKILTLKRREIVFRLQVMFKGNVKLRFLRLIIVAD